jgi:hypothetical protein
MLNTETEINIKDFKGVSTSAIDKNDEYHQWHSCCVGRSTDSRLLKFVSLYLILLGVVVFCLVSLSNSTTCEDTTTYISLLTLILGVILPQPNK